MLTKKTGPYILIIFSLVLLVLNVIEFMDGTSSILSIISNLLLILAMVLVIRENKKKAKEKL